MLNLQLDDRALYMKLWRQLLLKVLTPESLKAAPLRIAVRDYVENWGGRAAADSVGYRIVRLFHDALAEEIFAWLLAPCLEADRRIDFSLMQEREAPLYRMVSEQPPDLLHPGYSSWSEQLLDAVDRVAREMTRNGQELGERNWGEYNTVQSHHPLSLAFPVFDRWLDMRPHPLPGDQFLPRVQTPENGASERFAVSPGREEEGILHMPCGQSGHPFSPHYSDGHSAWVNGEPTPFLAGPPLHSLVLMPSGDGS
jgi:penicillin amidase